MTANIPFGRVFLLLLASSALAAANLAVTNLAVQGQEVDLRRATNGRPPLRVDAQVEVKGKLRLPGENGEVRNEPVELSGKFQYTERTLESNWEGDIFRSQAARLYQAAEATLLINQQSGQRTLPENERLIVVESSGGRPVCFSPLGPLSADDLELIDLPVHPQAFDALVPNRTVKKGEIWTAGSTAIMALLGLDDIVESKVEIHVAEANGRAAKLRVNGTARASVQGVSTEIELKANGLFDFHARQVTWLAALIHEQRAVGHAAPGLDVQAKVIVSLAASELPAELSNDGLRGLRLRSSPEALLVRYRSPKSGFELLHDRRWHLMTDDGKLAVFRFVDGGDLIAQCNISPSVPREKPLTLSEFQQDVTQALSNHQAEIAAAGQSTTSTGNLKFEVVATGGVDELAIQWDHVHLMNPQGRGLGVVFTFEPSLLDRLAGTHEALVDSIQLTNPPTAAAAGLPTPATRVR